MTNKLTAKSDTY